MRYGDPLYLDSIQSSALVPNIHRNRINIAILKEPNSETPVKIYNLGQLFDVESRDIQFRLSSFVDYPKAYVHVCSIKLEDYQKFDFELKIDDEFIRFTHIGFNFFDESKMNRQYTKEDIITSPPASRLGCYLPTCRIGIVVVSAWENHLDNVNSDNWKTEFDLAKDKLWVNYDDLEDIEFKHLNVTNFQYNADGKRKP